MGNFATGSVAYSPMHSCHRQRFELVENAIRVSRRTLLAGRIEPLRTGIILISGRKGDLRLSETLKCCSIRQDARQLIRVHESMR